MKAIDKKFHCVYKITNLINNKYYIGIHSTDNLNDEYMGSGSLIRKAIKKYGKENFKKEILKDCLTRIEASDYENQIVNQIEIDNNSCYNLKTGGDKGFINPQTAKSKKKISDTIRKNLALGLIKSGLYERTKDWRKQRSELMKGRFVGEKNSFYGKTHTAETRQKIGEVHKGKPINWKHSEIGKKKISETHLGKIVSEETRNKQSLSRNGKILYNGEYNDGLILQLSLNDEIINIYESIKDIPYISTDSISKCCRGLKSTYKGFIWKFKEKIIENV